MRKRSTHPFVCLAVLLAYLGATQAYAEIAEVSAKNDTFELHQNRARQLASRGKYAAAIKEYRAAYVLKQSPALLFNLGVCHQRLENYAEAVGYYAEYLRHELVPREPILKELEDLLTQMKAISEEVQSKKHEVMERLCSFSLRSPSCSKFASANASGAGGSAAPSEPMTTTVDPAPGLDGPFLSVPDRPPSPNTPDDGKRRSDKPERPERAAQPLYKKGWFWGALIGGMAAGSLAIGLGAYYGTHPQMAQLPTGYTLLTVTMGH